MTLEAPTTPTLELTVLRQWLGRTQQKQDSITLAPLQAMAALLDQDPATALTLPNLPPLWHWLYFHDPVRQSELAADGHPRRGGFLPPVALPRRMWAGGRLSFHRDIPIGGTLTRTSRIDAIDLKQGRSGPLAFVTVTHRLTAGDALAIIEEHDIVYRAQSSEATVSRGNPAPADCDFSRPHQLDATALFRYSALTFNAHRIHYDRDYATGEEGYQGLVVHGPLLATLLLELLRDYRPGIRVEKFAFRALAPVLDARPIRACGRLTSPGESELWIADYDGRLCMQATAQYSLEKEAYG